MPHLEITEAMVKTKLDGLKPNKYAGPDGPHRRVISELNEVISKPLATIVTPQDVIPTEYVIIAARCNSLPFTQDVINTRNLITFTQDVTNPTNAKCNHVFAKCNNPTAKCNHREM